MLRRTRKAAERYGRRDDREKDKNMTPWKSTFAAAVAFGLTNIAVAEERASIAEKYKWNLAEIYPTEQDWEKTRQQIAVDIGQIGALKARLGRSAEDHYRALALRNAIGQELGRRYTYAHSAHDIDACVRPTQQT